MFRRNILKLGAVTAYLSPLQPNNLLTNCCPYSDTPCVLEIAKSSKKKHGSSAGGSSVVIRSGSKRKKSIKNKKHHKKSSKKNRAGDEKPIILQQPPNHPWPAHPNQGWVPHHDKRLQPPQQFSQQPSHPWGGGSPSIPPALVKPEDETKKASDTDFMSNPFMLAVLAGGFGAKNSSSDNKFSTNGHFDGSKNQESFSVSDMLDSARRPKTPVEPSAEIIRQMADNGGMTSAEVKQLRAKQNRIPSEESAFKPVSPRHVTPGSESGDPQTYMSPSAYSATRAERAASEQAYRAESPQLYRPQPISSPQPQQQQPPQQQPPQQQPQQQPPQQQPPQQQPPQQLPPQQLPPPQQQPPQQQPPQQLPPPQQPLQQPLQQEEFLPEERQLEPIAPVEEPPMDVQPVVDGAGGVDAS